MFTFKRSINSVISLVGVVGLLAVASMSIAKPKVITPSLSMQSIKMIKSQEASGDELYLTVTAYPHQGKPSHIEIPRFPQHWLTKHLDKVKDVALWQGKLAKDESATVVISLIDRDVPPWNIDDLVGTVQVLLQNKNGKLVSSWKMPNRTDAPEVLRNRSRQAKSFVLQGRKQGEYKVSFVVKK